MAAFAVMAGFSSPSTQRPTITSEPSAPTPEKVASVPFEQAPQDLDDFGRDGDTDERLEPGRGLHVRRLSVFVARVS